MSIILHKLLATPSWLYILEVWAFLWFKKSCCFNSWKKWYFSCMQLAEISIALFWCSLYIIKRQISLSSTFMLIIKMITNWKHMIFTLLFLAFMYMSCSGFLQSVFIKTSAPQVQVKKCRLQRLSGSWLIMNVKFCFTWVNKLWSCW